MQDGGARSRQQDKPAVQGGIARTTAPSQDRTRRCLCADARRDACACTGLDRRGSIVSPAPPLAGTSSAKAGKVALDKDHGILRDEKRDCAFEGIKQDLLA